MTPGDPAEVLAARIRAARRVTVLTGAGVSAASGVPTFRGAQGLWKTYRPEELATPAAFARDPHLVWEWYQWRRQAIARSRPNPAHEVLAGWTAPGGAPDLDRIVIVVTQNVDDLHLRAGTKRLIRLHGSIWELACAAGCGSGATPWRDERPVLPELPPRCPFCGGVARPAVAWFGETLKADVVAAALQATACDVFLTVGTSSVVYPAAGLVQQAQRRGAFTVEINQESTPASPVVHLHVRGAAEVILPAVNTALWNIP